MTHPHDPAKGLSRRTFLKGTAIASAATTGLGAAVPAISPPEPEAFGPGTHEIQLRINGKARQLEVETRTTLLDALRDGLDLTGAKKICDRGACGGCTVHLDGAPINSCLMLAMDAVGHDITTIESLSEGDAVHPLVESFSKCDAMQCGFCTPGMVMTSLACLQKHGHPTREQMVHDLSGNLCRCGTYGRVMEAIERTAGGGR
ncbi:MAG: 2Fe-2S iron-sulfur cluster binding domain-containing protein [Planctomycetes bacterium]|nr:2Fe-2S iron-sulfur cluster binding domain-containing protein [Planctomycetota bacterium]